MMVSFILADSVAKCSKFVVLYAMLSQSLSCYSLHLENLFVPLSAILNLAGSSSPVWISKYHWKCTKCAKILKVYVAIIRINEKSWIYHLFQLKKIGRSKQNKGVRLSSELPFFQQEAETWPREDNFQYGRHCAKIILWKHNFDQFQSIYPVLHRISTNHECN